RGAAMSLASIDTRRATLTWIGVGNVQGVVLHSDAPPGRPAASALLTRGGVVGSAMPQLRAEVLPFNPGDVLFFATDGVDGAFSRRAGAGGGEGIVAAPGEGPGGRAGGGGPGRSGNPRVRGPPAQDPPGWARAPPPFHVLVVGVENGVLARTRQWLSDEGMD